MRTIILLVPAILCVASAHALEGSGTAQDPCLIKSIEGFDEFAQNPDYWDDHIRLETHIDLTGRTYTTAVIAPDTDHLSYGFQGIAFTGTFDGNNKAISNLSIDTAGAGNDYLGLFGTIGPAAEVRDLRIENAVIKAGDSSSYLGALCGRNESGTIRNCCATGSVSGAGCLGGLCGENAGGTISNCWATASVSGNEDVGGLCGDNVYGTISNCRATGSVSGRENLGGLCGGNNGTISNCNAAASVSWGQNLGGLCGWNSGTISNCRATGQVAGGGASRYLGGLCGHNLGIIGNCCSTGQVTGLSDSRYLGGLCGDNSGRISNCYAMGQVTGGTDSDSLGGLCGWNNAAISNCYAAGPVSGYGYLGGLCGKNQEGTITNCYATGRITGFYSKGGLCGHNAASIVSCFWDTQTSQMSTSDGGTPKTTAQMQTQSTFTDAGWDFVLETANGQMDHWYMPAGDCPKLWWQNPLPQDTDFSGAIDLADLRKLCEEYLLADGDLPNYRLKTDTNADGQVDLVDFAAFATQW